MNKYEAAVAGGGNGLQLGGSSLLGGDMAELLCTVDVFTAESVEYGDAAERGYVDCLGRLWDDSDHAYWDLREVLAQMGGRRPEGSGGRCPDWLTFEGQSDDHLIRPDSWSAWRFMGQEDVIGVTVSVHRPRDITDSSWLRICRMLGWKYRY